MVTLRLTRRRLLRAAPAAVIVVPRYVLGGPGHTPPSAAPTRATVGTGAVGMIHVLANTPDAPPVQVAVCDVDRRRLAAAAAKAGRGCRAIADFRRIMDRTDVDVVVVATPPHWHALVTLAAVRAGKDVLCEKPFTRSIAEGRAVADAARRYGRVVCVHTMGRDGPWRTLRKAVTAGVLGRPLTVRLGPASGFGFKVRTWLGRTDLAPQPVPADLDYDFWLGPAPAKPYHPHRVHRTFRGYWDYDGGGLTDMGQHWLDGVHYALGLDDAGPVHVSADGPQPAHADAVGPWRRAVIEYADGTRITLESGEAEVAGRGGERGAEAERYQAPFPEKPDTRQTPGRPDAAPAPFVEGPAGRAFFDPRRHRVTFDPPHLGEVVDACVEPPATIEFPEAVTTRSSAPTRLPGAEAAHRSVTPLHLANLAIRLGRAIRWDPSAERVVGDDAAECLVNPPMRPPWHL